MLIGSRGDHDLSLRFGRELGDRTREFFSVNE